MKAVAYYRVSTLEQGEEGYSLPAQRERIRKFALGRYEIVREFSDIMSASGNKRRKGFQEMIQFLKDQPEVRVVLATKVDRLFRNFRDYVSLYEIEGIKVEFSDERIPGGATGQLLMDIRVAVARHFINNLREDVIHGMEKRAESGLYVNPPPYGYFIQDGRVFPDSERADLVKIMFELYSTGKYSLLELSQEMSFRGMRNRLGRCFSPSQIYRMLKNRFYLGEITFRGKTYQGVHEPLISYDLFQKVQEVLERHRRGARMKVRHRFAYSGLVRCGYCGCMMTGEMREKNGKTYKYYKCTGSRTGKSCIRISEPDLSKLFEDKLREIEIPTGWVDLILDALRETYAEDLNRAKREREELKSEYDRLQNLLLRAYEDKLEGKISEEFWLMQKKKWEEKMAEIKRRLINSKPYDIEKLCNDAGEILYLASHIHELYVSQPESERRKLLEHVCSDSRLTHEKLDIIWRSPFDLLVKAKDHHSWCP